MNSNSNPSIDPANNGSLPGSIRFAFGKMLQQVDGMLPARVIRYDRTENRVQVQLLIAVLTTNNTQVSRPQLANIPVMVFGGGGFMLSFPLTEGDLGWVMANDRDISLFLQSYNESPPNTTRVKNFSDAVFIPDVMRNYTIDPADDDSLVLSTTDGMVRIAISDTAITIKAPLTTIDGNLIVTGNADIEGDATVEGAADIQGGATIEGGLGPYNLYVTGNIGASGTITPGV